MVHYVKMENGKTETLSEMLNSIERYNPDHLDVIETYVTEQALKNTYDLESCLAVLKLYQFNPNLLNMDITHTILLKTLANLPHTDFVLAKCLLLPAQMQDQTVKNIIALADILENCDFPIFWAHVENEPSKYKHITGFFDSIRKFVCHVVGITFQTIQKSYLAKLLGDVDDHTLNSWLSKNDWKLQGDLVYITTQDENIKTKKITEKIEFENLAPLMAACL